MGGFECTRVRFFALGGGSSGAGESEEESLVSLARFMLKSIGDLRGG